MKKNISINISGIIFHIEEDGYDTLRKYLDSINQYFGSFEDSSEILADIESRIAEIFLSKLNDGKQIITAEDVTSLTATMGSVSDFRAAEAEEGEKADKAFEQPHPDGDTTNTSRPRNSHNKRLIRDQRRKILGGVCAGLGNYFGIDPVWPRILFALAAIGTYGIFIFIYVVLWIVLPFSNEVDDEPSVKKMFRDPDEKVIGGVAAGIAAFFGIDITVVRVLFGLSAFFFGTGILLYIILWMVLPEAKTITDKMKMQGEPVTLSNIESSVKKGLNEKDNDDESTLAKIVLFPFRMIAAIISGIARLLGPVFRLMIDIFRVAIGLIFSLTGLVCIFALIVTTGTMLGMFHFTNLHFGHMQISGGNFPLDAIRRAFPTWTVLFAFFAALIPCIVIMLIGNSIISKRNIFNGIAGWTLFVLFFVSVAFLSIRIPQLIYSFKVEGEVKVDKIFSSTGGTPFLKLKETGLDDYDFTNLNVKGYDGKEVKLAQRFGAQGISRLAARENAQNITYNTEQQDSVITFDSNLTFKPDAKFSFQRLDMDLLIPFDRPFAIEPEMWRLIQNRWQWDFSTNNETQTFRFVRDEKNIDGQMECVTCPPKPKDMSGLANEDQFGLKDFKEVELTGLFNVIIRQSDEYAIKIEGSDIRKKQYVFAVNGETLEVEYGIHKKSFWKENFSDDEFVTITILMPELRNLKITGAGKVKISGFRENEAKINMVGAMTVDARLSVDQLYIDLTGPIVFDLDGDGNFMEATISGSAQLKASSFSTNHTIVEATGLSQARVNASQNLEIDADLTSNVKYSGDPQVVKR